MESVQKRQKMMKRTDVEQASNCSQVEIVRTVMRAVLTNDIAPLVPYLEHYELLNLVTDAIRNGHGEGLLKSVKRFKSKS